MTHHTTPTPQPERRAKHRADRSAAATTTACSSCTTATALHRVHLPFCITNQCRQGHKPCPTPQACVLPDYADTTDEAPATGMEITGLVLAVVALVVAVASALYSCASA